MALPLFTSSSVAWVTLDPAEASDMCTSPPNIGRVRPVFCQKSASMTTLSPPFVTPEPGRIPFNLFSFADSLHTS